MRDAHGGFHLVHVLAALAAGTVGIHLQILVQNLDVDGIGNLRRGVQGRKGSVPLSGGIKGGNAHQAVNAAFVLQITVGILPVHLHGHGTDAGIVAVRTFQISHRKAAAFAPAHIHAQQHGCPVAGLRAAGSGVNRQITGSLVLRSVQQGQQLKIGEGLLPFAELFHSLASQVVVIRLLGQFNCGVYIFQAGLQGGKRLHPVLQGIHFRHQRPRGVLVIPKIRGAHAFVQLGYSFLYAVQVKDSSRARKDGCARQPCRAPRDLQRYGDPCAGTYHESDKRKRAKCRAFKSSRAMSRQMAIREPALPLQYFLPFPHSRNPGRKSSRLSWRKNSPETREKKIFLPAFRNS